MTLDDYRWTDFVDLEIRHKDDPDLLALIAAAKARTGEVLDLADEYERKLEDVRNLADSLECQVEALETAIARGLFS